MAEDWSVEDLLNKLGEVNPVWVPAGGSSLVFAVPLSYEEIQHIKWALKNAKQEPL